MKGAAFTASLGAEAATGQVELIAA